MGLDLVSHWNGKAAEKYWNLKVRQVTFIGDMNWGSRALSCHLPVMKWMAVWISMLLKLVKGPKANDTPGCKCGTGLSPEFSSWVGQVVWLFKKIVLERRTISSGVTWVSERTLSCRACVWNHCSGQSDHYPSWGNKQARYQTGSLLYPRLWVKLIPDNYHTEGGLAPLKTF